MENESIEVSLVEQSVMVQEREYHLPVVLFTKDNINANKPIPVVNLPHVMFIGGPKIQGRTGIIQVSWDPERSLALIIMVWCASG